MFVPARSLPALMTHLRFCAAGSCVSRRSDRRRTRCRCWSSYTPGVRPSSCSAAPTSPPPQIQVSSVLPATSTVNCNADFEDFPPSQTGRHLGRPLWFVLHLVTSKFDLRSARDKVDPSPQIRVVFCSHFVLDSSCGLTKISCRAQFPSREQDREISHENE